MKLAILGTRGVPPAYGGFETFAAELGTRLVTRGHDVTVYCRRGFAPPAGGATAEAAAAAEGPGPATSRQPAAWRGIRRIVLPALPGKYLETVSHTFLSAVDALRRDFDAILLCNAANAFVLPLLRARRIPVAINVDGIERKRRKWNALGRAVYAAGEAFSVEFASAVVGDAEVIVEYYRRNWNADPVMIPYGADFPQEEDSGILRRLGLSDRGYILYVSRFEPENNPLEVVLGYEALQRRLGDQVPPLVMVGQGLYAPALVAELRRHVSAKVLLPGAIYGADYRTLQRRALVYVQATEVGGTHPALIEAMGSGGCVVALGTPENREVGGDVVRYFDLRPRETLSSVLEELIADGSASEALRLRARERVRKRFSWEAVTGAYEALLSRLAGG